MAVGCGVDTVHPIELTTLAELPLIVKNVGSKTVFYKQGQSGSSVSSTLNDGSITAGNEFTVTQPTWVIAKEAGAQLDILAVPPTTTTRGVDPVTRGADPSGVRDSTSAISEAFDLAHAEGRDCVFNVPGTYVCKKITKAYGLNVEMAEGVVIQVASGVSGWLWSFEGSLGAELNLEAEAAESSRELKPSSLSEMSVGSVLLIGTKTLVPEGQASRYRGQLVEVRELKAGETKVKLRERLYRTFEAHSGTDKTTVQVVNTVSVNVLGGKFTNPTKANCRFVQVVHGRAVDVNTETDTPLQPAIEIQNCYGFRVTSRSEHGEHDNVTKFGYAVAASAGSCHGTVNTVCINGNFAFSNTGVDTIPGEPYDITITGLCDNSSKSGVFFHPEGHGFTVSMQIYNPTENGVEIGCPDVTVQGCTIFGPEENGVRVVSNATSKVRIIGNSIRECGKRGVYFNNTNAIEDAIVSGNVFDTISFQCVLSSGELIRYRQYGNAYRNYGTAKSEQYWSRFIKKLVSSVISDETIDATGAGAKVLLTGEACEKTVAQRITVTNRQSGTEWAELKTTKTASLTGAEETIEGVKLRSNFIEA